MKYVKLGDLLVKSGAIAQGQLDEALSLQADTGQRLGSILQDRGFITEKQLIDTLMSQLGVEFIDLNTCPIPPEMARVLPRAVAEHYAIIPVLATWTAVRLAMADPLDQAAIEAAGAAAQRPIIPLISSFSAVKRALLALYGPQEEA